LTYFEVERWLKGRGKGTQLIYLSALKSFADFTGFSPKQLIDLAEENRKKSARERGDPELKITSFFEYLTTEYIQRKKSRSKKIIPEKKGLSRNLAFTFAHSILGFYKQNGFPLILKIPKAVLKKENFKLTLRIPEIKCLIDATTSLRDKAIIITMVQSGMSINELLFLFLYDITTILIFLQCNTEPNQRIRFLNVLSSKFL